MLVPGSFFPPCFPVTYTIWLPATSTSLQGTEPSLEVSASFQQHQVLKPKPGFAKERSNMDELVGMSQLSIAMETSHETETPMSLKLIGEPSRPSAFHSNGSVSGSGLSKGSSAIQATWNKKILLVIRETKMWKVLTGLNQRKFLVLGGNKPRHKRLENNSTYKERTYQIVTIDLPKS